MSKNFLIPFIAILFITGVVSSCSPHSGKATSPSADKAELADTVSGKTDPAQTAKIEFEKDFHDFGKITQGERVTFAFKFKNSGKSVLLISDVSTSCGCTISDYPKKPVMPGESGQIAVRFDSEGKRGQQNKTVTVFANTQPNSTMLHIQAMVMLPEDR